MMTIRRRVLGGLIMLGLGVVATVDLNHGATERILPTELRELIWFGPALAVLGCLTVLRGFVWGERFCSRRKVLVTGLVILVGGAIPMLWALATDPGGDASWANGMVALMAVIFAVLPGLFLVLAALFTKSAAQNK